VAGWPVPGGPATLGPVQEVSVRLTRPVRAALIAAARPVSFDILAAQLGADFPDASAHKVDRLLHDLVDQGVLLTSLRSPMTTVNALAHLISALRAAGAQDLADIAPLLSQLEDTAAQVA